MVRLSPKACLLFLAVSADVIKAIVFPQRKQPSLRSTPRALLSGPFNNRFNISPVGVSSLSESFCNAVLPQSRMSCGLEVPGMNASPSVLIATCEEIGAERAKGKLSKLQDVSHSDITNKSPLKPLRILLPVALGVLWFVVLFCCFLRGSLHIL